MRHATVLALIALAIGTTWTRPAHAETINVPCDSQALADAIAIANANAEEDDLWLAPGCAYAPPATLVIAADAGNPVTIYGGGATVSGSDAHLVLIVSEAASLHLDGVTIAEGATDADYGGGLRNLGTLTLTDCSVSDNVAEEGFGGGIYNRGALRLTRSAVSGNSAGFGGGIYTTTGKLTLVDSTVDGNTATFGGGIGNDFGEAALFNSTLLRNSATFGGGVLTGIDATTTLSHVTLSGNLASAAGGGVFNHGRLVLDGTVIANSTGGDCANGFGTATSSRVNLIEDGSCNVPAAFSGDPLLGKPTGNPAYLPLGKKSPAIDAADGASCPSLDQRGAARPQDGNGDKVLICDLGAYEAKKKGKK